jgi:hypothetical protein
MAGITIGQAAILTIARLCWRPIHCKSAIHGGTTSYFRFKLGTNTLPVLLMVFGFVTPVALFTAGGILLAINIQKQQSETETRDRTRYFVYDVENQLKIIDRAREILTSNMREVGILSLDIQDRISRQIQNKNANGS